MLGETLVRGQPSGLMFSGQVPGAIRAMLAELLRGSRRPLYVGCSGNFTIERALKPLELVTHGNDVTLYTCALGSYFAGDELPIELAPPALEAAPWLADTMETFEDRVATVAVASGLAGTLDHEGRARPEHPYYARLLGAYREQWPRLHAAALERLRGAELGLASFTPMDVREWIQQVPADASFVCYPPFQDDVAARFYQTTDDRLALLFRWPAPAYELLDDELILELFQSLRRFKCWAFGTNKRWIEFEPFLRGVSQPSFRTAKVYQYASSGKRRLVTPRQQTEPLPIRRLSQGEALGERLSLLPLKDRQFNALRSQYMNISIRPGPVALALAVLVDDRLVGVFAFGTDPPVSMQKALGRYPASIYLASDFPVRPTDYPRLAKLVLYAALSREAKLLAERTVSRRVTHLATKAGSYARESMKYRGLFEKLQVREQPVDHAGWGANVDATTQEYYRRPWEIDYAGEMGRWSLAEALVEWKQRHDRREEAVA